MVPAKVICALLLAGTVVGLLDTPRRLGDASNYVLMADSLLHDGDLYYEPEDLERARAINLADLPAGLMLVRRADGVYVYGKPALYPAVALPWYAAFGVRGFVALNGFLLAALVVLGAELLAPVVGWQRGLLAAAVVYLFSAAPAYLHWIDPFLLLMTLIAGGVLAVRRGWMTLAGVAFGATAVCRFPYAVLGAVPVLFALRAGRPGAALRYVAGAAAIGIAATAIIFVAAGQWSPYTGERYYFPRLVPFQTAAMAMPAPFTRSSVLDRWQMPTAGGLVQDLGYFLVGRAGGVLLYFPTFFACALWARRWNAEKLCWLGAVVAFALALELTIPHNRLGGSHAIGNRFFVLLPIGLCFIDFVAWRPLRVAASALLATLAVPVLLATTMYSVDPGRVLLLWPHRLFPFEWPLANHVSYPVRFPRLFALTENQYYWEDPPGAVWTIGGTRAEFVTVRSRDREIRVKLWSLLPEAEITNGDTTEVMQFDGAQHEITLREPRATFLDEYSARGPVAVYYLAIATDRGIPAYLHGDADDARYLGVYVQPIP